jgi:hypothetical protein
MRKILTLSLALLFIQVCKAQLLNKAFPAGGFSPAIAKVVENYPNNYKDIQGELLPSDEDRDIFRSIIIPAGASQCVIYRFHSKEDSTASWQCILFEGEEFADAAKMYKNIVRQMKQLTFKVGETKNSFVGETVDPKESLRFTTTILRPEIKLPAYRNFIAEIEMINSFTGWTVQLNLHSRKDDRERYQ